MVLVRQPLSSLFQGAFSSSGPASTAGQRDEKAMPAYTSDPSMVEKEEEAAAAAIVAVDGKMAHKRTKKRGALHLVRVALFMLRRSRKAGTVPVDVVSRKGPWQSFLTTVRMLHHHESPAAHDEVAAQPALPSESIESFHSVVAPPQTPSVDGMSSRYASAEDLNELDQESETENEVEGDHGIDQLAEEFIARFYEQMRLQRLDSIRRYNEMIATGA